MKTVKFVSLLFHAEMKIRLTDRKYDVLMHNELLSPLQRYNLDAERVSYGFPPQLFSEGQIKKLKHALLGLDIWDKII